MHRASYILVFQKANLRDLIKDLTFTDEDRKSLTVTEGYLQYGHKVFEQSLSIHRPDYAERITQIRANAAQAILSHFGVQEPEVTSSNVLQFRPPSA